jgi:hypothetical protein
MRLPTPADNDAIHAADQKVRETDKAYRKLVHEHTAGDRIVPQEELDAALRQWTDAHNARHRLMEPFMHSGPGPSALPIVADVSSDKPPS